MADWFSGFCAIHGSGDGLPEEELAAPVPKPKKRRGRPSKKVLQRVRTQSHDAQFLIASLCLLSGLSHLQVVTQ